MTMVAVTDQLKPNPNIPGLIFDGSDEKEITELLSKRKTSNEQWTKLQEVREGCNLLHI